jgi:SAM-dependent methyltransferase
MSIERARPVRPGACRVSNSALPSLTKAAAFHDPAFPSTEDLDVGQRDLIAAFNRGLASGQIALEEAPCLCGSTSFDPVAEYDRYRIRQPVVICRACGLVQLRPRMTDKALDWFYGSDQYRAIYNPHYLALTEERFRSSLPHSRMAFLDSALAGKKEVATVLEIGCAAGQNLIHFHEQGKRVVGYDLGPAGLAFGKSLGMDLRSGTYQDVVGGPYDLIILSHVMEHFNDPVTAVAAIADNLSPDGRFYIEVPDNDEFCLGALQNAHVYYFTERTLLANLAKAGLEAVSINRCTPHIGVLCRRAVMPVSPDLSGEYNRAKAIIRRHDRKQRLKEFLDRLGLLAFAKKLAGRG